MANRGQAVSVTTGVPMMLSTGLHRNIDSYIEINCNCPVGLDCPTIELRRG